MNFLDLVKKRQSDRRYTNKVVERSLIETCVEAARLAPSACNAQPWSFIIVDEPLLKDKIARAATSPGMSMNKFVSQAPAITVIVMEQPNITSQVGSLLKNRQFRLLDIGMAAEHFCLQAAELGLGTCMIGWFQEKHVKKLLGIPKVKRIALLITVGYPDNNTIRNKIRKKKEDLCFYNRYP